VFEDDVPLGMTIEDYAKFRSETTVDYREREKIERWLASRGHRTYVPFDPGLGPITKFFFRLVLCLGVIALGSVCTLFAYFFGEQFSHIAALILCGLVGLISMSCIIGVWGMG
jgi:hypothetical protein